MPPGARPRDAPQERTMKPTPDFDPRRAARTLLREARSGALATLMTGSGDPYCSLVNVATGADGAPLLLISRLAVHTKNILADPRVSLMLAERGAPRACSFPAGRPIPRTPPPPRASRSCSTSAARAIHSKAPG